MGLITTGQFRLTQRCCAENPHMDLGDTHTHEDRGNANTRGSGERTEGIQGAHTHRDLGNAHTHADPGTRTHPGPPACSPYNMAGRRRRLGRPRGPGSPSGPAGAGGSLEATGTRRKEKVFPLPPRPSGKLPLPPRRLSPQPASAGLPAPADSPAPLPRRPRNAAAPDPGHRLREPPGPRLAAVTAPPSSPQAGAALPGARSGR